MIQNGSAIQVVGDFSALGLGSSDPVQLFFDAANITDPNQQSVYQTLFNALDTAGVLSKLAALFINTENQNASLINIVQPDDTRALVNAPVAYAERFTKAGAVYNKDMVITYPFINTANQDNNMFLIMNVTAEAATGNTLLCKTGTGTGYQFLSKNLSGSTGYRIGGTIHSYTGADNSTGTISADLNGMASKIYRSGTLIHTETETSGNIATTQMIIGDSTSCTQRAFAYGISLTDAQHSSLYNALQAFDTSWNAL